MVNFKHTCKHKINKKQIEQQIQTKQTNKILRTVTIENTFHPQATHSNNADNS